MFQEHVTNKDGVSKRVVANSKEELAEAVKAVKDEQSPAYPNIDNPDHGNLSTAAFEERGGKRGPTDAEANPTSRESKEVSRALADVPRSERPEVLAEVQKDVPLSETVKAQDDGVANTVKANEARSPQHKSVDSSRQS